MKHDKSGRRGASELSLLYVGAILRRLFAVLGCNTDEQIIVNDVQPVFI